MSIPIKLDPATKVSLGVDLDELRLLMLSQELYDAVEELSQQKFQSQLEANGGAVVRIVNVHALTFSQCLITPAT